MKRLAPHFAVLAAFAALTVIYTAPLIWNIGTAYPGTITEAINNVWNLWHFRYCVSVLHQNPLYTDMQYWPLGANLILPHYTLVNDVLAYPLLPVLGLNVTYNLLWMTSFAVTGWAVYALCRDWGIKPLAAFTAGVYFTFSPVVAWHMWGGQGVDYASLHHLPLFIWAMSRAARSGRLFDALLASLALTMVFFYNYYYFLSCALVIPLFWLVLARPFEPGLRRVKAFGWVVGLSNGAALGAFLWMASSLWRGQRQFHGAGSAREVMLYVLPYAAFWAALAARLALSWRPEVRLRRSGFSWRALSPYAGVCLCWAALNWPLIWAVLTAMLSGDYGASQKAWRGGGNPVDLGLTLLPNAYNPLWGGPLASLLGWIPEKPSFGWIASGAALWLWRRGSKDQWTSLWFAAFAFFFVLMLGPWVELLGRHLYLPLPFYFLHLLPVFSGMPNGVVFNTIASLFLAVIMGQALHRLGTRRACLMGLALVCLECWHGPLHLFTFDVPPVMQRLRARPDGAFLPVPVSANFHLLVPYGYYGKAFVNGLAAQTVHQKPFIGGELGRMARRTYDAYMNDPFFTGLLAAQDGGKPDARLSERRSMERYFRNWHLRYVLVDRRGLPPDLAKAISTWPMREIDRDEELILYETRGDGA